MELGTDLLSKLLTSLGAHLEAEESNASIVVVGGAALSLRGWVPRTTQDVDVIAIADASDRLLPPNFPPELEMAIARVARDFSLREDWLNSTVGSQWRAGLPTGIEADIDWRRFANLRVGLAGRQTLITLKLFAAVDQGPESVHVQDLLALAPDDTELDEARAWVLTQDQAPEFPDLVAEAIAHVARHRRTD